RGRRATGADCDGRAVAARTLGGLRGPLCSIAALLAAIEAVPTAAGYSWPLKPFHKMHPIRVAFDDPRFHLDAEGQLSALRFGVVAADGNSVSPSRVRGSVDVEAEVYDTPPLLPRPPWQVARLTPAFIWWRLLRGTQQVTDWTLAVDFHFALMPASLYNWIYAP